MKIGLMISVASVALCATSAQAEGAAEFLFDNVEKFTQAESFDFASVYSNLGEGASLELYQAPMKIRGLGRTDTSSAMLQFEMPTPEALIAIGASPVTNFHCSQVTTNYPEGLPYARPFELLVDHLRPDYVSAELDLEAFPAFRNCESTIYFTNASFEDSNGLEGIFDEGNAFMNAYFTDEHFRMDVITPNYKHACVMGQGQDGQARMVTWEIRENHSLHISIVAPTANVDGALPAIDFIEKPVFGNNT